MNIEKTIENRVKKINNTIRKLKRKYHKLEDERRALIKKHGYGYDDEYGRTIYISEWNDDYKEVESKQHNAIENQIELEKERSYLRGILKESRKNESINVNISRV